AGWITADLSNQVPYVVASLAAKRVDINALIGTAKSKPSGGGTITNVGSDTSGDHNSSTWSNSPIDFSPLKSINGKFGLSVEEINYANIKIKPGKVQAILSAGKLEATVANFNLYGGTGKGAIAVDASGRTPAQSLKVSLVKFNAYPFLLD